MFLHIRRQLISTIAGTCLLLSAGLNVVLGVRVSQQRVLMDEGQVEKQMMLGRKIEPVDVTDRFGRRSRMDFGSDARPTVLYTFRPGCIWCERNHEAVVALHAQASDKYRFVGLSLSDDGLGEALDRFPLPFEVVSGVESHILESYQLGGTPRTLVIGSNGVIEANFFGAFMGDVGRKVEAKFEVDLPAVRTGE